MWLRTFLFSVWIAAARLLTAIQQNRHSQLYWSGDVNNHIRNMKTTPVVTVQYTSCPGNSAQKSSAPKARVQLHKRHVPAARRTSSLALPAWNPGGLTVHLHLKYL